MSHEPIDTITATNKELHELKVTHYVLTVSLAIVSVMAIIFYNQKEDALAEVENLNSQMEYTVKEYNKLNHKYNNVLLDCDMLRQGNEALIKHATPESVNRAIKATPLPSMKG